MKKVFLFIITILFFVSCSNKNELGIKVRKLKKNETYVSEYKDHLYSIYISSGDEKELIYSNEHWPNAFDKSGKKIILINQNMEQSEEFILINDKKVLSENKHKTSNYYLLNGLTGKLSYLGEFFDIELDKDSKFLIGNGPELNKVSVFSLIEEKALYDIIWDIKNPNQFVNSCAGLTFYKSTDYDFKVLLYNEYQTVALATLNCENKEFITEIDDSDKTAGYWPMTKMPEDCKPLYPEWMW